MKGTDKITRQMLEEYAISPPSLRMFQELFQDKKVKYKERFEKHRALLRGILSMFDDFFPDGTAGYQEMLDKFVEKGRWDYAQLLLFEIGRTADILELDFIDDPNLNLVFAGSIHIKHGANLKRIIAGGSIDAGEHIKVDVDVRAGGDIRAYFYIHAGHGILAGCDIYAGCGIEAWEYIQVGNGIYAEWDIESGGFITAGDYLHAEGSIKAGKSIETHGMEIIAFSIDAGESIIAGRDIQTVREVKVGKSIEAGWGIRAGWGIEAGDEIYVGDDFEIYAGLNVRRSEKEQYAIVTAKTKPENLVSGYWVQK